MITFFPLPNSVINATVSRDGRFIVLNHESGQASLHACLPPSISTPLAVFMSNGSPAAFRSHQIMGAQEVAVASEFAVGRMTLTPPIRELPAIEVANARVIAYKSNLLLVGTANGALFVYEIATSARVDMQAEQPEIEAQVHTKPRLLRHIQLDTCAVTLLVPGCMEADVASVLMENGRLLFVDMASGEIVEFDNQPSSVIAMTYHPHQPLLAVGTNEGDVILNNLESGETFFLRTEVGPIVSLVFLANGSELIVLGQKSARLTTFGDEPAPGASSEETNDGLGETAVHAHNEHPNFIASEGLESFLAVAEDSTGNLLFFGWREGDFGGGAYGPNPAVPQAQSGFAEGNPEPGQAMTETVVIPSERDLLLAMVLIAFVPAVVIVLLGAYVAGRIQALLIATTSILALTSLTVAFGLGLWQTSHRYLWKLLRAMGQIG